MSYDNREMKSGHPAGSSVCPKCNAPLYYAAELKLHDRTERNVVYCSGGCGFFEHVAHAVSKVGKAAGKVAEDVGIAAAEVAGEFLVGGAAQE